MLPKERQQCYKRHLRLTLMRCSMLNAVFRVAIANPSDRAPEVMPKPNSWVADTWQLHCQFKGGVLSQILNKISNITQILSKHLLLLLRGPDPARSGVS